MGRGLNKVWYLIFTDSSWHVQIHVISSNKSHRSVFRKITESTEVATTEFLTGWGEVNRPPLFSTGYLRHIPSGQKSKPYGIHVVNDYFMVGSLSWITKIKVILALNKFLYLKFVDSRCRIQLTVP